MRIEPGFSKVGWWRYFFFTVYNSQWRRQTVPSSAWLMRAQTWPYAAGLKVKPQNAARLIKGMQAHNKREASDVVKKSELRK